MADIPKVSCTYCQEDINTVRIQCCECPNFDICLQCFAVGAEIGPHKNDHSYKFMDNCSVSIFGGRGAWTGREHLQLLKAAELSSYTNWELIAVQVENRTAEECREEYTARYLDGNIGKAMWSNIPKPNIIIDLVEDDGPLSQAAISKLAPLDATLEEAKILGYKPHRDDFEREYNPEAEQLVADIQMPETEYELEKALRLATVDMYQRRLRERQRRKRIVRDYQLVAKYFDNLRRDPSKPLFGKEQKELRDNMRIFAQFLNSGEHERFIASIERERELRHRLSELFRYRSLGMTSQEEIVHYEQHVAFQKQQIRNGKAAGSGSQSRNRLYQLAFYLGQQWLCDGSTGPQSVSVIRKRLPTSAEEWHVIAQDFYQQWNFPHCLGAMDGKHIMLQAPFGSGTEYFNYKGFFSIVLFGVVDANYCFTFVNVGCQGRISDGGVYANTSLATLIDNNALNMPEASPLPGRTLPVPYVFIGDDAFPLRQHILKPYPGLQNKASGERIFNYRLSRARRISENAFGILSSVFRVLRKPMLLEPNKATKVVLVCLYLHNFLRKSSTSKNIYTPPGTFDAENFENGILIPGQWRKNQANSTLLLSLRNVPRRATAIAHEIRTEFRDFFLTDQGKVPWQDNY